MNELLYNVGITIVTVGLLVEFIAFVGIAFYPVRRVLPVRSPLRLQSVGCAAFYSGVLILIVRLFLP